MRWQNWKEMPRPLKSWQFYHACRKALGDAERMNLFKRSYRTRCFLACESDVLPDKSDWKDELLDDFPPFSDFQQACRDHIDGKVPAELVQHAADELVREIKETVVSVLLHGR